jgi:ABC-type Mn2+/Zn2+ transport system permease subunit
MSAEMPVRMPANREFQSLLQNLITDVQEASVLWQIAVLVASLGLAWLFQRQFERRVRIPSESKSRALNISVRSMGRLLFPLLALALVIPGRWLLGYWYSTIS